MGKILQEFSVKFLLVWESARRPTGAKRRDSLEIGRQIYKVITDYINYA
jgi:hypothetical protein